MAVEVVLFGWHIFINNRLILSKLTKLDKIWMHDAFSQNFLYHYVKAILLCIFPSLKGLISAS